MKRLLRALAAALFALTLFGAAPQPMISIDIRDADIYDVVQALAMQSGTNIVLHTGVKHVHVTFRVLNRPFADVLTALCEQNDLLAVDEGSSIMLGRREDMARRGSAAVGRLGIFTEVIDLRNARADQALADTFKTALPLGTIVVSDKRANALIVTGSDSTIARARHLVEELDRPQNEAQLISTVDLPVRYMTAKLAAETIRSAVTLVAPDSLVSSDQQNLLVATGSSDFLSATQTLLEKLDRPGKQIVFEVRVADITSANDHSENGGILGGVNQFGSVVSGSTLTTFVSQSAKVNAQLNFLLTQGNGKILATPHIATLNNTKATLSIGTSYPVVFFDARTGNPEFQTVKAGVDLEFTPIIAPDGTSTVDMSCSYSEILAFVNNYPEIGSREAKDTLRVRDGETIVLAGLFQDVDSETVTKVPIFGNIPILGPIFQDRKRDHTRDEIIFLITPHLVADTEPAAHS
jgi:type II secretory pathway component GspD/PulD (secretin)